MKFKSVLSIVMMLSMLLLVSCGGQGDDPDLSTDTGGRETSRSDDLMGEWDEFEDGDTVTPNETHKPAGSGNGGGSSSIETTDSGGVLLPLVPR